MQEIEKSPISFQKMKLCTSDAGLWVYRDEERGELRGPFTDNGELGWIQLVGQTSSVHDTTYVFDGQDLYTMTREELAVYQDSNIVYSLRLHRGFTCQHRELTGTELLVQGLRLRTNWEAPYAHHQEVLWARTRNWVGFNNNTVGLAVPADPGILNQLNFTFQFSTDR